MNTRSPYYIAQTAQYQLADLINAYNALHATLAELENAAIDYSDPDTDQALSAIDLSETLQTVGGGLLDVNADLSEVVREWGARS